MTLPTVKEIVRRPEPTTRDTFVAGPEPGPTAERDPPHRVGWAPGLLSRSARATRLPGMPRLRSAAGQVAAEYMGGLLLVAVVIAALIGSQLHTHIAVEVQRAICKITGSSACGEPGVPQAGASGDHKPGDPDRSVYDAECKDDLPGRLLRGEGDDPTKGDPEANQVYDNLGQVFQYYADTFNRDSYDDPGPS